MPYNIDVSEVVLQAVSLLSLHTLREILEAYVSTALRLHTGKTHSLGLPEVVTKQLSEMNVLDILSSLSPPVLLCEAHSKPACLEPNTFVTTESPHNGLW